MLVAASNFVFFSLGNHEGKLRVRYKIRVHANQQTRKRKACQMLKGLTAKARFQKILEYGKITQNTAARTGAKIPMVYRIVQAGESYREGRTHLFYYLRCGSHRIAGDRDLLAC